jgi:phosphoribosylanthranilate isomerase
VKFEASTIGATIEAYAAVEGVCGLLVDGTTGGHGETFDWSALAPFASDARLPLVLAGGLTPGNVGEAIATVRPFAVDVSSGVERERGVKDHDLIGSFLNEVRGADGVPPLMS